MISTLRAHPRWTVGMGAWALAGCGAFSLVLWIGLLHESRLMIQPDTPSVTPMQAALQAVFDDGLASAGAAEYGSQHQGPLLSDGTINLVGHGRGGAHAGGFRVHKRSPFGSGIDHTMDDIDFTKLPEIKPAKYIDPHSERGVQWSGALVQLMEQGYAREDAQAALAVTGNDLEASAMLLLQGASQPGVANRWFFGGRDGDARGDNVAGLVLETMAAPIADRTPPTTSTRKESEVRLQRDKVVVNDEDGDFLRRS